MDGGMQSLKQIGTAAVDAIKQAVPHSSKGTSSNADSDVTAHRDTAAKPSKASGAALSPKMSATRKVFMAVQAHWLSACMHVMLELRVADVLIRHSSTAGQQGMHIDEIAQACGASSPHLYKVLRVLAQHEMLDELLGKHFTPNEATRELQQDTDTPSLGHMAHHLINLPKWDAWKHLPQAVKEGKIAFELAHGMDVYEVSGGDL